MKIRIATEYNRVCASFEHGSEHVEATGSTLTEAVENLVLRFKQLQEAALTELRLHGIITVDTKSEVVS